MKKKSKKNKNPFLRELEFYKREGIPLQLNGVPSTPKKIAKAHKIAEDITYMRDYVRDSQGRLTSLGFDPVKEQDSHIESEIKYFDKQNQHRQARPPGQSGFTLSYIPRALPPVTQGSAFQAPEC